MSTDFNFDDLTPVEISITIANVDYTLREASEDAARQYQNKLASYTKLQDGKVSGVSGPVADVQSFLVSLCLFTEKGPVGINTIRGWTNRIVVRLFEKIQEISDMGGDETEKGLEKELAVLQKKLAKIRGEEDPLAEERNDTTEPSD